MNTADYLLQHCADDDLALITARSQHSYGELKHATQILLRRLESFGVAPGDRVGILGSNSLFWVSSYLAALKVGAIAVPLGTKLPPQELSAQIAQTECKVLCVDKKLNHFDDIAIVDEGVLKDESQGLSWINTPDFASSQDAAWMLTSGTTAKPRIVRITHRNIQANTDSVIQYLELTCADRMMDILPFYYCFGTSLLHTHLRVGGSLFLGDTLGFPEKVLNLIEEMNCTGFAGVPTTFQMYLRNSTFPQRILPSLTKIQQAGGKLSTVLIEELVCSRPLAKIFIMYGQTEATARLSYLPPELLGSKLGSIGRGIPGVALQVVNEDGVQISSGEIGEVIAYGENISPGYVDEPEANAEKFVKGSLRTGDMATVDEEGFIYIVDRKNDFIKCYGNRVSSQEVEASILELKDVVAAAVIGVPDPLRGEAIRAFVVLRSKAQLTEDAILTHCAQRLARYMIPREVIFIPTLPTNQHGKVVKTELRNVDVPIKTR